MRPTLATTISEARALGARVERIDWLTQGATRWPVVWVDMDPRLKPRLLEVRSREDAADPELRQWALAVRRRCTWPGATRADVHEATARALHSYVRDSIAFVPETEETFQRAAYTLRIGAGDCDDHATALRALLLAAGIDADLFVLWTDDAWRWADADVAGVPPGELPRHVTCVVPAGGAWCWAETTIAAAYGEHPQTAVGRLGLHRADLTG